MKVQVHGRSGMANDGHTQPALSAPPHQRQPRRSNVRKDHCIKIDLERTRIAADRCLSRTRRLLRLHHREGSHRRVKKKTKTPSTQLPPHVLTRIVKDFCPPPTRAPQKPTVDVNTTQGPSLDPE